MTRKRWYPPEDNPWRRKPASFPTTAMPGTLEKLAVLAGRAERGEELFHADDAIDEDAMEGFAAMFHFRGQLRMLRNRKRPTE